MKRADRPVDARFPPRARGPAEGATRRRGAGRVAGAGRVDPAVADPRSLTTQEQARVAAQGRGSGRTRAGHRRPRQDGPLVGGIPRLAGLSQSRSRTRPARCRGTNGSPDWARPDLDHDLIVVATPLKMANEVLLAAAERRPTGLIFDIGSLKTPLRAGLAALQAAGVRVTSVHPMFGPDTELLSGRHVIFIDVGDRVGRRRGARAVRVDDGRSRRDGSRGARSADRLRARAVARTQHRVLHGARRERRDRAAPRAHVEHDLRCAARRGDTGGGGESGSVLRDPEPQRVRRGIAERAARGRGAPVPLGARA